MKNLLILSIIVLVLGSCRGDWTVRRGVLCNTRACEKSFGVPFLQLSYS